MEYARQRLSRQQAGYGASLLQVQQAQAVLNPQTLTLGFARRFATYKRPTLLLHDRERLARILTNPQRPVQLVLAGKAHPADQPGQALIREWTSFRPATGNSSACRFSKRLRHDSQRSGWLKVSMSGSTRPRRPWEASGTSGMKVLVNGGLNLSILDGWWAEAYTPEVGWAIGDGKEHGDDPAWIARMPRRSMRFSKTKSFRQFYRARRARHSAPVGCEDPRKYGRTDAGVFREPDGAPIHRGTLYSRGNSIRPPRMRRLRAYDCLSNLARGDCPALERCSFRRADGD